MNRQIIDVYGDGSLTVEGNVGDLIEIPIPERLLPTPVGSDVILVWAGDLLKVGLLIVEDRPHKAIFQIMDISGV